MDSFFFCLFYGISKGVNFCFQGQPIVVRIFTEGFSGATAKINKNSHNNFCRIPASFVAKILD
jgi:hypothetical protein